MSLSIFDKEFNARQNHNKLKESPWNIPGLILNRFETINFLFILNLSAVSQLSLMTLRNLKIAGFIFYIFITSIKQLCETEVNAFL